MALHGKTASMLLLVLVVAGLPLPASGDPGEPGGTAVRLVYRVEFEPFMAFQNLF